MEELWDIARVAEYLGVSERTVYNRVRAGELPAIKLGRLWRVRACDLEAWLSAAGTAPLEAPVLDVPGPYPLDAQRPAEPLAAETPPLPTRADLEDLLAPLTDQLERRLAFVGLLTRGVELLDWPPPVIVGGHAVEFYTAGDYPTVDIDLVGASEPVDEVLGTWGFSRQGRHWFDEKLGLVLEVPGHQLGPEEARHVIGLRSAGVRVFVLGLEDLIVDRLNGCVHWGDADSCMWVRTLLTVHGAALDWDYLRQRARNADVLERLENLAGEVEGA